MLELPQTCRICVRLNARNSKTRRGLRGKTLAGLSAGGVTYGYDVATTDDGEPGARTVNAAEAVVVRRIFEEAAAGRSPRDIAKGLNADGIAPPRHTRTKGQREWGDTTIRGQTKRGTGILNNELYVGRLVWDRCSYVKDPATGKRVARPKPPEEWERTDVPHLRIVTDDLWDTVKARQAAVTKDMSKAESDSKGHALARANRPKHMLSGLLVCGECGSPFILVGKDYYGCNRHRSKGTCGNGLKVRLGDIEGRVVDALRHWLLQPDVLAKGVANIRELVARVGAEAGKETAALRRKLASLEGQVSNIVDAIATGMRSTALAAKLAALEAEAEAVKAAMAEATAPMPEVPDAATLAEAYRLVVDNLVMLGGGARMTEVVRRIVTKVTLTPTPEGNGLKAEMEGSLTRAVELLQVLESEQPASEEAGCSMAVVAGAGFEPAAFRL
ncbi:recombinase family protein [Azospirillum ramasamyi]